MPDIKHIREIVPVTRPDNKLFQYVLHLDELTNKGIKDLEIAARGAGYIAQVKYDGVFACILIKEGKVRIFSRTGKRFTNLAFFENMIESLLDDIQSVDGLYFGELTCPSISLEELSGMVNPNRKKALECTTLEDVAVLYLFDYVTEPEFLKGHSYRLYNYSDIPLTRTQAIEDLAFYTQNYNKLKVAESVLCSSVQEFLDITDNWIAKGHEGGILRTTTIDWLAGHKGYRCTKKVRSVSYDLECVGVEVGEKGKRTGLATNLLFRWKDGVIKADLGKGWSDADRLEISLSSEKFIGKVYKVYGLQDSSKGKIRLAKVGEIRIDKTEPDY